MTPTLTKKVLVGGCFDILHYGHVCFLAQAKARGNFLVVALESDETILETKKRHPIHTQQQRAAILMALRCVDQVISLPRIKTYEGYLKLVKEVGPEIIAITQGDPQKENKQRQAHELGINVAVVSPMIGDFSSSRILSLLGEEM